MMSFKKKIFEMGAVASMSAEDMIDRLATDAARMGRRNPFYTGQVVTPAEGFGIVNVGIPHVVIRCRRLQRNRSGWGTTEFGKMADLQLAFFAPDGTVRSIWTESYAYDQWNEETHGVAFDERADKTRAELEQLKATIEQAELAAADAGESATSVGEDGSTSTSPVPAADPADAPPAPQSDES